MKLALPVLVLAATVFAAGCGKAPPPPPPPVEVSAAAVVERDVPVVSEWIATLDGSVNADIRPKVEGYLLRRSYKEGQFVHAGDPCSRSIRGSSGRPMEQAQGRSARPRRRSPRPRRTWRGSSRWRRSRRSASRSWTMRCRPSGARKRRSRPRPCRGGPGGPEPGLDEVSRPSTAIAGIAQAQVGDLVNPQTVMTTVSTVDPIRVMYGSASRNTCASERINRANDATSVAGAGAGAGPGRWLGCFRSKGAPCSPDREIDVKTGTMTITGLFPNPGNMLRPGQYAKVRATTELRTGASSCRSGP